MKQKKTLIKIKELKRKRNNIYKQLQKVDNAITKEESALNEKEKEKYVGKYFRRKGYNKFPEYVKILKYTKKGYEIIGIDVDNEGYWLSRYITCYLPEGLEDCSKKLFEEKLEKGLKKCQ